MTLETEPPGGDSGRMAHVLLLLTLLLIAVQPIGTAGGGVLTRATMGAVLVACVAMVYPQRRLFVIGLALGIPALGILVLVPSSTLGTAGLALGIMTLGFVVIVLLQRIFRRPAVSLGSVSASLVVYLLLGIMWAMAYSIMETLAPGSFYGLSSDAILEIRRDLFYYSFVTLTTLGYGDIGPVGPGARSLAITEAVVGQLYLVVLVASLVGMFLSGRSEAPDRK